MQSHQFENQLTEQVMACHECDLLVEYPDLEPGSTAVCPRCDYVMTKRHKNAMERLLAFAVSGLIFLLMSAMYPFLSFSAGGQDRVVTLLQSIDVLADEQQVLLALLVMVVILIIPAAFLMGVVYVVGALKYWTILPPHGRRVLRFILALAPWSMVEIFLIGTMVSLIKIASLATISLGMSFWSYIAFTILMTLVLLHLDKVQVWSWVENSDVQTTV
jgi:paraquat-inducible protein A